MITTHKQMVTGTTTFRSQQNIRKQESKNLNEQYIHKICLIQLNSREIVTNVIF